MTPIVTRRPRDLRLRRIIAENSKISRSSPFEVYRVSIENEVGTEKGSSQAKHEVGCGLMSVAKECSRQTNVLQGSPGPNPIKLLGAYLGA